MEFARGISVFSLCDQGVVGRGEAREIPRNVAGAESDFMPKISQIEFSNLALSWSVGGGKRPFLLRRSNAPAACPRLGGESRFAAGRPAAGGVAKNSRLALLPGNLWIN
jgi:hypothetical protein